MNFHDFSDNDSLDQDDQNTLSDQLNKTKTLTTKFFTDLNRHQKTLSKKIGSQTENKRKNSFIKNKKKKIPTFREMIMASKSNLEDGINSKAQIEKDFDSKKKVRFDNPRPSQEERKSRKTSIEKNTPFNFTQTIKQMALMLTDSRKNVSNQSMMFDKTDESLFNGYTQKQFQDGTKFKGICESGVITKGELHFQNGFVYDGELFLDKFHGKGKLILPKGQVIEADWIQGEIVGKATIKYSKGQIYYGDVKEFRRHGQGYLFFNDGSKYEGEFIEGELTGFGIHITTSNEKTQGYWFYGDYIGQNEQVFENVMSNVAAHEKKKSQKQTKKIKFSKGKNSRNSKNLLEELFRNLGNVDFDRNSK